MNRFRFPIAVAVTSLALVAVLAVAGALTIRTVLAGAPWAGGPWHGGPWGPGAGFTLPPALAGLRDVPAEERFSHFLGAQVNLTDKDGQPLAITVTPGTITAADASSVTIAANDGSSRRFTTDNQTIIRAKAGESTNGAAQSPFASGEQVVVVTLNNSDTATAIVSCDAVSGGPGWRGGPWGHAGPSR